MKMDVKIKVDDAKFKLRVSAIYIRDNKLLVVMMDNNNFYCLPGGHIHLGETSYDACLREFKEEVRVDVTNAKLFATSENFFTSSKGKKVHEITFYYIVETKDKLPDTDFTYTENDEGKMKTLKYIWMPLNRINEFQFRPAYLVEKLKKNKDVFEHIVIKD